MHFSKHHIPASLKYHVVMIIIACAATFYIVHCVCTITLSLLALIPAIGFRLGLRA